MDIVIRRKLMLVTIGTQRVRSPSPVTDLTFGTGVRWEFFHRSGNTPDDTEQLKIAVTGLASSGANSLRRRAGILSGPEVL